MKQIEHVTEDGEITTGLPVGYEGGNQSLAVSLARAEVDQQIMTARALPRAPAKVMQSILSLATLDEKTAEECVYALPRGGKPIKGPSIRLAEIIGSQWGNARIGARVVHVDRVEKYIEAEGVFHDLETNTATTARVRRRISDKHGRLLNEDMIVVTGNAACAIAKRNAILGAVPKAVWRKAYDAVEAVIAGDAVTLVERRTKAMKAFAAFGVNPERVCQALGVTGVDDISLEHMPVLMGAHSALKNNEATVEEMFPAAGKSGEKPKSLQDRLDDLASGDQNSEKSTSNVGEGPDDVDQRGESSPPPTSRGKAPEERSSSSGATPTEAEARAAGAKARADGKNRKAVPVIYRNDERLLAVFLAGFDGDEEDEREPGEEG